MKIYTRNGDDGTTGLFGGSRVSKSSLRIETYGTVDELNSWIGVVVDHLENQSDIVDFLVNVQDRLFTVGSMLAADPTKKNLKIPVIGESDVIQLEKEMDTMDESLPAMKSFVLPGGSKTVSFCHVARCVCRRAERNAVHLASEEGVDSVVIHYLNRLSDYLFVLSRAIAHRTGTVERPWLAKY